MVNFRVRAHLALKEGLKANYNSWHMWENFLVVSIDFINLKFMYMDLLKDALVFEINVAFCVSN